MIHLGIIGHSCTAVTHANTHFEPANTKELVKKWKKSHLYTKPPTVSQLNYQNEHET